MSKKLGVGIIGCGTISDVYLTNLTSHYENMEVLMVADLFVEKAKQTAEKYNIPSAGTVEELLVREDICLVLNLTIPGAHYSVNKQVLMAGKNVYCEKPLTLNIEEGKEIVALAKEKGLIAVSAPDTFLGAGGQTCRTLLDAGRIGKPIGFSANMTCAGHELWHPNPAFYYKNGGGPMWDMGPYYVTMLVALLGPIRKISCFATKGRPVRKINGVMTPSEVPTNYCGLMEFECGATGTINMSFDTWQSNLPCLEIYGTEGSMTVPDPNLFTGGIKVFDGKKLTEIVENYNEQPPIPIVPKLFALVTKTGECFADEEPAFASPQDPRTNMRGLGASDLAQAIMDGRKARLDMEVSLHVVEALAAFEISSNTGKVYEMTTTCERPEAMGADWALWEVK